MGTLDADAARSLAAQLQQALQAREVQLERKFQEVAGMQDLTQQLMVRHLLSPYEGGRIQISNPVPMHGQKASSNNPPRTGATE